MTENEKIHLESYVKNMMNDRDYPTTVHCVKSALIEIDRLIAENKSLKAQLENVQHATPPCYNIEDELGYKR